jgi:hypothetical protein
VADQPTGAGVHTSSQADSDNDLEEREAIQAVDGEAVICVHCGELVGSGEPSVSCDGGVLHERCHDAYFGFERQDQPHPSAS